MANKDRNKRSARKARAAEREQREAVVTSTASTGASAAESAPKAQDKAVATKAPAEKKVAKKGRIRTYFDDVKTEMHRVVWPSRPELKNYTAAVVIMLVIFGVAVWLVDTGVVGLLVGFSGLRG